jgi:ubiquinone/menaquinone biosynthesis C-methylase UbiE
MSAVRELAEARGWVLDAACGTGSMLPLFESGGFEGKLLMIDASGKMVRKTRDRARESGLEVEVILGDVNRLPFKAGCVDGIACIFSITTVRRPVTAISEFTRCLRGDGKLVVLDSERPEGSVVRLLYPALVPISRIFCHTHIDRDVEGMIRAGSGWSKRTEKAYFGGMVKLYSFSGQA